MNCLDINLIKALCKSGEVIWSQHSVVRCQQRGISSQDIESAIITWEIIENYPTDYPYPSCLVLGFSIGNNHIHVVCGVGSDKLWIITAYFPSNDDWQPDMKTRKGND